MGVLLAVPVVVVLFVGSGIAEPAAVAVAAVPFRGAPLGVL